MDRMNPIARDSPGRSLHRQSRGAPAPYPFPQPPTLLTPGTRRARRAPRIATEKRRPCYVRFSPDSDRRVDMPGCLKCAKGARADSPELALLSTHASEPVSPLLYSGADPASR
jgi:hypothetical protein